MFFSVRFVALCFLVLHLLTAIALPLFDDETYYTLWARWPALGYYDHPPMIAYIIHLGVQVFGENSFGVRIIGILGMAISSLLVGDTSRRLGGTPTEAALATLLYNIGFLALAIGAFATPDSPSTLFWLAGLWAAIVAVQSEHAQQRKRLAWWIFAGLLIGLGGVSKFTNVFLAFGLLGWLMASPQGRRQLASPMPYIAILAALLPLMPYAFWNAQNDWLGFERQSARLAQGGFRMDSFMGYFAAFIILPTPLVTWFALRGIPALKASEKSLLLWSMAPLLVYFTYHATHDQVQANWLIPVQGSLAILAACALMQAKRATLWTRITTISGAVLSFGLLALILNPWAPIGTADTPPNQGRGWDQTRADIQALIDETGAQWIATTDYARTGMFAVQFPDAPVHGLQQRQRYSFRPAFDLSLCDAPAVLIEKGDRSQHATAPSAFALDSFSMTSTPLTALRSQAGKTLFAYTVTPVRGLKIEGICGWTLNRH